MQSRALPLPRLSRRGAGVSTAAARRPIATARPPPPPSAAAVAAAATATAAAAADLRRRLACSVAAVASALALTVGAPVGLQPAAAADTAAVGACLLSRCQGALAGCVGDATCLKNLVCLNKCGDDTACQIKCGDQYSDKAIDTFNACAVSNQKCVPQRVDEGLYPVPPDCALDAKFDLAGFTGRWYITAGLNPLFDIFPCQARALSLHPPSPPSYAAPRRALPPRCRLSRPARA